MRVVPDANVLVSAAIGRAKPEGLHANRHKVCQRRLKTARF